MILVKNSDSTCDSEKKNNNNNNKTLVMKRNTFLSNNGCVNYKIYMMNTTFSGILYYHM
jgi:hypothetical protein